jgi:hypothetical protein
MEGGSGGTQLPTRQPASKPPREKLREQIPAAPSSASWAWSTGASLEDEGRGTKEEGVVARG